MTLDEMRALAVQYMKSRKGLNAYTNSSNRKYFFGKPSNQPGNTTQKGFSDCSSACRAAIKAASDIDPGSNTHKQLLNRANGEIVEQTTSSQPDESKLKPGDLLYFKGNKYHTMYVGHVEMYTGNDTLCGHGSGTGPRETGMRRYCASRASEEKRYFMAIRWIPTCECPEFDMDEYCTSVVQLQSLLLDAGYKLPKYGADGLYGPETKAAVSAFQKDANLPVTGTCNEVTWKALKKKAAETVEKESTNPYATPTKNLARGAKGEGVKWIQWELTNVEISCGPYGIDGDFGKDTLAAVLQFQTLAFPNEPTEWDGIVGPKTRAKLVNATGTEIAEPD